MARPCSAVYLLSRVGRRKAKLKEHAMRTSQNRLDTISTIGIDVGKNTFHLVGFDKRGAIVLQQKVTRHQLGRRLSNIPHCLIGMEVCSGTHFIARQLTALGHDVRLIPAQYVKPFLKGPQKRLPRCRGNRASGATTNHALRGDQDAGADGFTGPAPCAFAPCQVRRMCPSRPTLIASPSL
jgi:hypothetical protein